MEKQNHDDSNNSPGGTERGFLVANAVEGSTNSNKGNQESRTAESARKISTPKPIDEFDRIGEQASTENRDSGFQNSNAEGSERIPTTAGNVGEFRIPEPDGYRSGGDFTDSTAGGKSAGTESTIPPKRGRHRKDCTCSKCEEKRQAVFEQTDFRLNPPKGGNVFNFPQNVEALTLEFQKALKVVWEGIYQMPVLAGYGAFWALQDNESQALTDSSINVLKTIEPAKRKAIMVAMNKYVPITALLSTALIITYPRVFMTQQMKQMERLNAKRNSGGGNQRTGPTNAGDNDSGIATHENPAEYVTFPIPSA